MPDPGQSNPAPNPQSKPRARPAPRSGYPESVDRLIEELARLPGVGRRSAERLAFFILKSQAPDALALANAIEDVKSRIRHCRICFNLADTSPIPGDPAPAPHHSASAAHPVCAICAAENPPRDRSLVMVVEQPKDLIALEQTGMFKGVYHVLMGCINPMDGIGPGELTVADLLARIDNPARNPGAQPIREVVLGLNPTLEGDGTALYLAQQIEARAVRVTRLARGLPTGSQLEYASKAVLADAIEGRRPM